MVDEGIVVRRTLRTLLLMLVALIAVSPSWLSAHAGRLAAESQAALSPPYPWQLPAWMPRPPVPVDNPMTEARVTLGRHLFFDSRLSGPSYLTCGHCHHAAYGFADFRPFSFGMSGKTHPRNTPGLANVGYLSPLGWVDPDTHGLEAQTLVPLFNTEPVEMMARGMMPSIQRRLAADRHMRSLFEAAFPATGGRVDLLAIQRALAAYQRSLLAFDTAYDRFRHGGDAAALSASARTGLDLFESPRIGCALCHVPPLFTDASAPRLFEGTGLGAEDPRQWRHRRTALEAGHGRITDSESRLLRTPALRNLGVTAPYMHDARFATLADLLADYRVAAAGGLSAAEQDDLLAFLRSLNDPGFLSDRQLASPYRSAGARAGDPDPPPLP